MSEPKEQTEQIATKNEVKGEVPEKPEEVEKIDESTPVAEPTEQESVEEGQHQPKSEQDAQSELTPASAVEGGREISKKILYVGGLDKSVGDEMLKDMFSVSGPVVSVKVLNDKNKPGFNYAFIEFETTEAAESALKELSGRIVNTSVLRINWAYQSSSIHSRNPDEPIYNIFVGDLSPEVDDETLSKAFSKFQSLKQAHVMWDMQTSRSRGYGFVSFGNQTDAELALQTMNGEWISGRAIRCNWATHKQMNNNGNYRNNRFPNNRRFRPFVNTSMVPPHMANPMNDNGQFSPQQIAGMQPLQHPNLSAPRNANGANASANIPVMSPQSYDIVLRQTPSWQTTVYLGNISHFTQQGELIPLLQNFGFIVDFKFHPERGCAFVKYDSHERAALAIVQLAGFTINGRPLKCGWGKDRPPMAQYQNFGRVMPPPPMYGQGRP